MELKPATNGGLLRHNAAIVSVLSRSAIQNSAAMTFACAVAGWNIQSADWEPLATSLSQEDFGEINTLLSLNLDKATDAHL